jgi:hypothetical protein
MIPFKRDTLQKIQKLILLVGPKVKMGGDDRRVINCHEKIDKIRAGARVGEQW